MFHAILLVAISFRVIISFYTLWFFIAVLCALYVVFIAILW